MIAKLMKAYPLVKKLLSLLYTVKIYLLYF